MVRHFFSARRRSPVRHALQAALVVALALVALPYALMPFYAFGKPVSTLMIGRWFTLRPVERDWLPLSAMGRSLPLAVIVAEDARFCSHGGIDWEAFRQAVEDLSDGEAGAGGSTITQQVVKNLFLWPGRSYLRKALEVPLAMWMDLVLSKPRILEIYLNIAEWGPDGRFGARAGARHAFSRDVAALSRHQAGLLAAVLPNPQVRSARRPDRGVRRRGAIYAGRAAGAGDLAACLREGR